MVTWFRRGDLPEPPPPEVAKLGMAPGYTVREFDDPTELDAWARGGGISASDQWNAHTIASAVNNKDKVVGLLSRKATNDDSLYDARAQHEYAHTWNLYHDDAGKNWQGTPDAWSSINMANALNALTAKDAQAADPASSAVQLAKSLTPANDDTQDQTSIPATQ